MSLLKISKPLQKPPYRAGNRTRDFEAKEVGRMVEDEVIESSRAEWASVIAVVPKKV